MRLVSSTLLLFNLELTFKAFEKMSFNKLTLDSLNLEDQRVLMRRVLKIKKILSTNESIKIIFHLIFMILMRF